jgi:predicted phage tail protein
MTNIILHGILAKEFQPSFRMKIHKAVNVVKAINANRTSFNKRILDLAKEGLNYTIIVDGKKITELEELNIQKEPQEIHLVPLIVGSGPFALGSAVVTAIGSIFVGGAAAGAFAATAGGVFLSKVVGFAILTAASIGLQMLLAPKPDDFAPISATTKALQESFLFSDKTNVASQGAPIPIGYGRLKVGSQIIQSCLKSYPQTQESTVAMTRSFDRNIDQGQLISSRAS